MVSVSYLTSKLIPLLEGLWVQGTRNNSMVAIASCLMGLLLHPLAEVPDSPQELGLLQPKL